MHTNTKTTVLAISAILMTIALVTSSSLVASAIAVKTHKSKSTSSSDKSSKGGTSSSTTGVSKLVSCIRALPSTFTRADVDHCYDTVFNTGGSTASSVGGASSAGGSTLGTP